MPLEQEVKLAFESVEAARRAVTGAGARPTVPRRLIDDQHFDTPTGEIRRQGGTLRLRQDGSDARITWKGPVVPGAVKTREEVETFVGDGATIRAVLHALGYGATFRGQKYREGSTLGAATVTIDETPCGVFVEIEATPEDIARVAGRLGRGEADYRLESYPALWRAWCQAHGRPFGDMMVDPAP